LDLDRDQCVTCSAGAGLALALEPHLRAALDAGGKLEIDRRAVRQADALRLERGRVHERHLEPVADVGPALRRRLAARAEARPGAARPTEAAEQPLEDVAEIDVVADAETLEVVRRGAIARARVAKAPTSEPAAERHRRIAVRVDFAAVEPCPLVLVRQQ